MANDLQSEVDVSLNSSGGLGYFSSAFGFRGGIVGASFATALPGNPSLPNSTTFGDQILASDGWLQEPDDSESDLQYIQIFREMNEVIGGRLAEGALTRLSWADYSKLAEAGFEIGRYDGVFDYVVLRIGGQNYLYVEPSLWGNYRLISVTPGSFSFDAVQNIASYDEWGFLLNSADVTLSVFPGGSSAGSLEEGNYLDAGLWAVGDAALTLSVLGKVGQVGAKASYLKRSEGLFKLSKSLAKFGKIN